MDAARRCATVDPRLAAEVTMNPIVFALRRPVTVMMLVLALALGGIYSIVRMQKDIFPSLNQPVLYVIHNYGGMDPKQIEGLITNVYELFFQYINSVEHVESRSIQSMVMLKLYFQPGTDMAEATAQTVAYCNRALAVMPVGSLPPYVVRLDAGSLPVGYLVFESKTRSVGQLQDLALFRVRPMFSGLAGISSPPPFGGNIRTIVVNVDPDRLRSYNLSPQDVVDAIDRGNFISPSGNVTIKDQFDGRADQHDGRRPAGAAQRPAEAGRERLHPRRRHGGRRDRHPRRLRAGQRPQVGLPAGGQAGLRLDPDGRQRGQAEPAAVPGGLARRRDGLLRVRRVADRLPRHRERGRRGGPGRRPDRPDGPALPPRPPGRDRRGAEHPAGAAGLDRRAEPDRATRSTS